MKILKKMALAVVVCAAFAAQASAFSEKPTRLIVPLAPGGGGDVAARLVAAEMSKALGEAFIVENRPGASSVIGTSAVAKAEPDGHTLLWITDFHSINEAMNRLGKLQSKLPYDSLEDFDSVGQAITLPIALLASSESGIQSVEDFTRKAREANGEMSAGMLGEGSPHYLAFANLQRVGGFTLIEVPYGGSGPATIAVQAGEVDVAFSTVGAALQMEKGGRVKVLGVSSQKRDPHAPNVPTIAESGYPNFEVQSWMGILAPKGVSPERLTALNKALNTALANPEVKQKLEATGMYVTPSSPEAFSTFIKDEAGKMEGIYRSIGK